MIVIIDAITIIFDIIIDMFVITVFIVIIVTNSINVDLL